MLNITHAKRSVAAKIDSEKITRIKDFIQGSIYCFCKNCPNEWFAARDLFGGENYYWQGTPLYELYQWHEQNNSRDPVSMAAKDIGWLLLSVIDGDKRTFELNEGFTHEYRWTGEEDSWSCTTPQNPQTPYMQEC